MNYKNISILIMLMTLMFFNLYGDTPSEVLKIGTAIKLAKSTNDLRKVLVDGNVIPVLCGFITKGTIACNLLSTTSLNPNEDEEIRKIKTQAQLEKYLSQRGIQPDDFYKNILENKDQACVKDVIKNYKNSSSDIKVK